MNLINSFLPKNQEYSPQFKRLCSITGNITLNAGLGYAVYWLSRLVSKVTLDSRVCVLMGVVPTALIELLSLVYDFSLLLLGDRKKIERLDPEKATTFDRLRQRSWKVIGAVEQTVKKCDTVFSNVFNIRTAEKIKENRIADEELYFMEVVRSCLYEELNNTVFSTLPTMVGFAFLERIGYQVLSWEMFRYLPLLTFVNRITLFYKQRLEAQSLEDDKNAILKAFALRKRELIDTYPFITMLTEEMPKDDPNPFSKQLREAVLKKALQSIPKKDKQLMDYDEEIAHLKQRLAMIYLPRVEKLLKDKKEIEEDLEECQKELINIINKMKKMGAEAGAEPKKTQILILEQQHLLSGIEQKQWKLNRALELVNRSLNRLKQ